jgi:hypothetical protein
MKKNERNEGILTKVNKHLIPNTKKYECNVWILESKAQTDLPMQRQASHNIDLIWPGPVPNSHKSVLTFPRGHGETFRAVFPCLSEELHHFTSFLLTFCFNTARNWHLYLLHSTDTLHVPGEGKPAVTKRGERKLNTRCRVLNTISSLLHRSSSVLDQR